MGCLDPVFSPWGEKTVTDPKNYENGLFGYPLFTRGYKLCISGIISRSRLDAWGRVRTLGLNSIVFKFSELAETMKSPGL